jgi:hypothetical protein
VSNWIESGGDAPHPWTDDGGQNDGPENAQGRIRRWSTPLLVGLVVLLPELAPQLGHARDRGQFANANPELRAWFNGLKSQTVNGSVCLTKPSSPSRIGSAEPWSGRSATAWADSIFAASCPAA